MKNHLIILLISFLFALNGRAQTDSTQVDSIQSRLPFTPLTITSFDAKLVDKNVQLQWTVSVNEEIKGFEVEKEEGGVFRKIGSKLSLGKTGSQAYDFVDALPRQNGDLLYRVKLITKEGNNQYSEAKLVDKGDKVFQYKLKQNPVRNAIELDIDAAVAGTLQALVTTAYGQKVLTETVKLSAGQNKVSFPAQNLTAGLHRLILECGGERALLSFVKE